MIKKLKIKLQDVLPPKQIYDQYIDRLAKGTDAGFYRLIPQLVVVANSEEEIIKILELTHSMNIPVTFKAAGTSLSGQTISDAVLIEIGPDFNKYKIEKEGAKIVLQPGVRGGFANLQLAKYGYKIGPSPASINAAKIGGIVANNASGASYGIVTNSYNTIQSMRIVMVDGTVLDTACDESKREFKTSHAHLLREIAEIKQQIVRSPQLLEKIKHKYLIKNTTGYGMNSFLDFDDSVDIIAHLMVGSEGTLGFISELSFNTIKDNSEKTCVLLFLPDIKEAAKTIIPLRQCKVSAAELMDRNALRAVEEVEGLPALLKDLPQGATALLVETSAESKAQLLLQKQEIIEKLVDIHTLFPISFTDNARDYNTYWKVRKGLFTSAAATRPNGTTCIIEDVTFPGDRLEEALPAIQQLMEEHGYKDSVTWGHLLDGNIHFLLMPDFEKQGQLQNYKAFMNKLVYLVVDRFNGSLKGEHGTGRNMAPFVEYEWGSEIYELMKKVKAAFDPKNILNPGVLINDDPEVYVKNIKPLPLAHPIIDTCIECGFCESSCPSQNLTLTPRQRIAVFRAMTNNQAIDSRQLKELHKAYRYKGDESCATDGLCALNCPVGIDTGKMIKELRFKQKTKFARRMAGFMANHFAQLTNIARHVLNGVHVLHRLLPTPVMQAGGMALHKISGRSIPLWNRNMPIGAPQVNTGSNLESPDKVLYFPSCINRMFGNDSSNREEAALSQLTQQLLQKAGYQIIYPDNINKLCCGMAFDSKGFKREGENKLHELEKALLTASQKGDIPVLCDMSPCLYRMKERMDKKLKLYEPIAFTLDYLKDKLAFTQQNETVMVHSTCSSTKMGLNDKLVQLAQLCATEVINPEKTGCCGWAGDKGFNLPALNTSALKYLKDEVPARAVAGYSTSRTCEIGLSLHSGLNYQSILFLVDKATVRNEIEIN
ncbi:D-lactate dehydrogenase [Saccharicrinis carchari]|uniref:D-lactate dehydrogenase (cytochrome) n=1 Tax=Saccharicrinis carchari TaxID=1168039 RepID=A0A521B3U7_SACCC|nr:FAD-binding and (Fe-S)-binding domain-containing protein [Saccharicrinis carchari]SMO41784.1 D-lactate dehydrogenase [Saccharicrinis carchari]